ncbi:1-phosphatidylinositol-3-phosphate 5-kinase FAB1 [Phlyctema vagabunda]|uniref:1-phosphatidylinositol-3-phosphate 5-kinase n=1 Tax=Phlyctema vagabunda TaxID=108571 RepID=A0ABR4PW09_9HELO
MSANESPRQSLTASSSLFLPLGRRSRRGSLASLTSSAPADKEQLSQALDRIHSEAYQSDSLTTFNEFAPPPPSSSYTESKGLAGDLVQNGLSGLYSRFRGAVGAGKEKSGSPLSKGDNESVDNLSIRSQSVTTPTSKGSTAPSREDSNTLTVSPTLISTTSSRLQSPTTASFPPLSPDAQSHTMNSTKGSFLTTTSKSGPSSRPSLAPLTKATSSSAVVPTVAPVNVNAFKESETIAMTTKSNTAGFDRNGSGFATYDQKNHPQTSSRSDSRSTLGRLPVVDRSVLVDSEPSDEGTAVEEKSSSKFQHIKSDRDSLASVDGSIDARSKPLVTTQSASSALSSIQRPNSSRTSLPDVVKKSAAIERITQSHLPGYQASRTSSTDRSTAATSPVNTPAHSSIRHGSFSIEEGMYGGGRRIPGTTTNEGAPEVVSARLEQMRKQVLSKEFWMADEICKECFLCGDSFSAFRRKHHCRTCGCIFDSKCTSIISGQRFGVQGSLRVCKTCLNIINKRYDSSDSDDSADDSLPTFFQSQQAKFELSSANKLDPTDGTVNGNELEKAGDDEKSRPLATPMMAIPATRRIGESSNRRSAILEIDAPQLSRPSSARSLKTMSAIARPPSAGHRRHQSKHNFLGRFRPTVDTRAPFHSGVTDDLSKKSRLPAFHDDNIIDPDLAPYMSDEGSSGDEQMSIFATMNSAVGSPGFENDRSGFGSLLTSGKKHRARAGEKSVSGINFVNRGMEDFGASVSAGGFTRPARRRNLSMASNSLLHPRPVTRQMRPGTGQGFASLDEAVNAVDNSQGSSPASLGPSMMTRSASMRDAKAPAVELNNASLHHVRRLLNQLLQDADIPNVSSWEKALIPILLQCTDDVNPDVRRGDDIDIRHYVKVKKIPGGKPGDTAYVSGVVFTKNLALKSMPRSIPNPRIVIVSFPIEYQRHQHHFMSLEPVIAQEKEFLRNMVNRIASLRPQLLLVQKHISGLALQYLSEANIAVAYNVKQSVIEAVSRCAQTEIISSIDMVALKPVHIGKSAGFDVKTYVHNDIPGKKKTYIYLSGCPKELGCTIALRGANLSILSKMKRITEFMVYVVYNLKLETCLMRDEFVLIPSIADNSGSLSPGKHQVSHASQTLDADQSLPHDLMAAASDKLQAVAEATKIQQAQDDGSVADAADTLQNDDDAGRSGSITDKRSLSGSVGTEPSNLVSAHESHVHGSHDEQVPEDVPMPTFYSDMVAKHQTKILSASPFVKFMQPYLLMRSREQERRLVYLKRLRDQDTFEEQTENEKSKPQKFQLIKPEMVHETVQRAPKQIMEVLHAVHDAEYDKAMHNYQTQKRQWENYIQGNLNLFDPYAHQNIVVLYTVVCTATTIPCAGPELLALAFYNEHETSRDFDPDCTLGQYVEDLCLGSNTICTSNGCERKMSEHHRTYVHGEARITVFVEKSACKIKGLQDSILMWSYCKICKKETQVMPMSESTWKYSLGKYLELSFWSSELRLRAGICPHDLHRDHLRYFGYRNVAIRIHYDPIDLLEIVVPRTRITWKVDNDLRLKNDLFTKTEEKWNRFMTSVKTRIKGINIDSVVPEKAEACRVEVERLAKRAQEEHASILKKLQEKYMESKYYEIIPLNRAVRAMQEKVVEWDAAFADFDSNFFPSEKDIRRLAALQLKKMFMDRDESTTSLVSTETTEATSDVDEKSPDASMELIRKVSNVSTDEAHHVLSSVLEENPPPVDIEGSEKGAVETEAVNQLAELERDRVEHLDLAVPTPTDPIEVPSATPVSTDTSLPQTPSTDPEALPVQTFLPPSEGSLSEKVEQIRKAHHGYSLDVSLTSGEGSSIPRPSDKGTGRRSGAATSPPMNRTRSQPAGTLRRVQPSSNKSYTKSGEFKTLDTSTNAIEGLKSSATEPTKPTDKKLSERLGLSTLKGKKSGQSLIPRSVHGKRKESKVTTLAKHFEQLSREFEKERMRDRKQRAAKVTQSRAFPKASSKPIVEVYKDVNEAVEERGPSEEDTQVVEPTHPETEHNPTVEGLANLNTESTAGDTAPHSPTDTAITADETATEAEGDENPHSVSQTGSDDEGVGSDADHSLLDDILPGAAELAESLGVGKSSADLPLDIPKHEKSSLMKMLTNFWAERSASGWAQLEYPLSGSDHVFADTDVIVREDEPSSLIAFALSSEDYRTKLQQLRGQGEARTMQESRAEPDFSSSDICEDGVNQAEVETSLLRATGTHLAYSYTDGPAKLKCKIFYAEQFDAVRRKCGVADRVVESLSRCLKWDSKGGKTKSVFLKTLDDRLVLKSLSQTETGAFLKFAPAYFNIMAEALFHDLPTVIAKMLGFFQIVIKNPITGTEINWDVLVMENLFYDRSPTRIFDLKGSMRNRKIQSTGEQNEVLLDENMVEFIYESPLFAREHSKKLLRAAIFNDTLFLQRNDVMDYSLMVAVDEARKELVVGIIDVVRTYTWDKKLESWIKDRGFAGGGRNRPTVTSPKEYKSRFREAMNRYILQAPNSWHQWQHVDARAQREIKYDTTGDRTDAD